MRFRAATRCALAAVAACAIAPAARAQTVPIWPGAAPGSEHWTQRETTLVNTPIGAVTLNVVTPTLTAYLPDSARATGAGIIVAPGGGFVALAMDVEATPVARWLQQHGIAAFVLKYRTIEKRGDGIPAMDQDTASRYGIADAVQALAVVRAHAAAWRVVPEQLGIMGFSAGGMVAAGALLAPDPARRPAFAALLYGAPFGAMPAVPARLPPVFMAWAQDDPIARPFAERFRDALLAAGARPEVHVFASGGHGFGLGRPGTPTEGWIDIFARWLAAEGFLHAPDR